MGLDKGTMINEKLQIIRNHRKTGQECTLIIHLVCPLIPMSHQ